MIEGREGSLEHVIGSERVGNVGRWLGEVGEGDGEEGLGGEETEGSDTGNLELAGEVD